MHHNIHVRFHFSKHLHTSTVRYLPHQQIMPLKSGVYCISDPSTTDGLREDRLVLTRQNTTYTWDNIAEPPLLYKQMFYIEHISGSTFRIYGHGSASHSEGWKEWILVSSAGSPKFKRTSDHPRIENARTSQWEIIYVDPLVIRPTESARLANEKDLESLIQKTQVTHSIMPEKLVPLTLVTTSGLTGSGARDCN
jgi:hypothetical protein